MKRIIVLGAGESGTGAAILAKAKGMTVDKLSKEKTHIALYLMKTNKN